MYEPDRDREKEEREGREEEEVKPTWKDFLAMTIAAYEIILVPMLIIFAVLGGVIFLFYLIF